MEDSMATVRAEILEAKKAEFDWQLDILRHIRDGLESGAGQGVLDYETAQYRISLVDKQIDTLLAEKDGLTAGDGVPQ